MHTIRQAILLAAGKGTRMGAHTRQIPKTLLAVGGRPLIDHILDRMQAAGIERVLVVTGHLGEQVREHVRSHQLEISFAEQAVIDGTARAALLGRDFAGGQPFLLTFGDILCASEDYRSLLARLEPGTSGVLGVKLVDDPWKGAAVYADAAGRVERIVEKPPPGTSRTPWNSAGVYAFRPEVWPEIERVPLSPRGEYEITSAVEQLIASGRRVVLYGIAQDWLDVGRPEDLETAERLTRQTDWS